MSTRLFDEPSTGEMAGAPLNARRKHRRERVVIKPARDLERGDYVWSANGEGGFVLLEHVDASPRSVVCRLADGTFRNVMPSWNQVVLVGPPPAPQAQGDDS